MFAKRGRVTPALQMEAAECGVACLCMVLAARGAHVSLAELRESCGTSRDGNSALDLLRVGREWGLAGRGLRVKLVGLKQLRTPAILHWNANHFVVLERVCRAGLVVVDPASGRRSVPWSEAEPAFSGIALELVRGPKFRSRRRRSPSRARYRKLLASQARPLSFVVAAGVAQQLLALAYPSAQQLVIDHIIEPERGEWLWPLLACLLMVSVVQALLHWLHGLAEALLVAILGEDLTKELAERLLRTQLSLLLRRQHGDLLARIQHQSEVPELLSKSVHALFDLVLIVLLASLMLSYDARLGALSLALAGFRVGLMRWLRVPLAERTNAELCARGKEQGALAEASEAVELTQGFECAAAVAARYRASLRERVHHSAGSGQLEAVLRAAGLLSSSAMLAMILWVGGNQVIRGEMTLGVFVGFLAIRALVEVPLTSLVGLVEAWLKMRGTLERCDEIFDLAPVAHGTHDPSQVRGRLEARTLGFRYGSGGAWVFRNVDLSLEPGEHVALVGASGRGKSTLAKVLCGLLPASEGAVLLDGVPIQAYDPALLARRLGVVLQDPVVFEGSVKDALCLRVPDATGDMLRSAVERAGFDSVIRSLPERFHTRLLAEASNLSGGERQRLAIAQACVGDPAVLVLDEATCSLDAELERRVLEQLEASGATLLSVAHRPSVTARADRVLELGESGLVEHLPHHTHHRAHVTEIRAIE